MQLIISAGVGSGCPFGSLGVKDHFWRLFFTSGAAIYICGCSLLQVWGRLSVEKLGDWIENRFWRLFLTSGAAVFEINAKSDFQAEAPDVRNKRQK